MRRLILLALVATAVLLPGTAKASVPCRDRIYNDWYKDGKIASTYPLACYRDAIKHVPRDADIYSSLKDDIRSALQLAEERAQGKRVPTSVGHGLPTQSSSDVKDASVVKRSPAKSSTSKTPKTRTPTHTVPASRPTTTLASAAPASATNSSSGLPVPILILGGLALVLAATGAIGAGVRHFRR
jgi:cobalamin biosynthesis Mg chelatase CobN